MKKDWKLFEEVVRIIQEKLKDSDNTHIRKNVKLETRKGRKREFDIVINANVGGIPMVFVIECKDWEEKVPVGEVEKFIQKCERVPGIDKKIMVSRKGFQEDGLDAAEESRVSLFTLERLATEDIRSWLGMPMVGLVNYRLEFDSAQIVVQDGDDIIFENDDRITGHQLNPGTRLSDVIRDVLVKVEKALYGQLVVPTESQMITLSMGVDEGLFVHRDKQAYKVLELRVRVKHIVGKGDVEEYNDRFESLDGLPIGVNTATSIGEAGTITLVKVDGEDGVSGTAKFEGSDREVTFEMKIERLDGL